MCDPPIESARTKKQEGGGGIGRRTYERDEGLEALGGGGGLEIADLGLELLELLPARLLLLLCHGGRLDSAPDGSGERSCRGSPTHDRLRLPSPRHSDLSSVAAPRRHTRIRRADVLHASIYMEKPAAQPPVGSLFDEVRAAAGECTVEQCRHLYAELIRRTELPRDIVTLFQNPQVPIRRSQSISDLRVTGGSAMGRILEVRIASVALVLM